MRIELTQHFTSSAADVDDAYADAALYPTLVGLPNLGRIEVVHHERSGHQARLSVRYAFTRELSAAVAAVIDQDKLTWIQESVHDLSSGVMTFRMLPDHYADRLTASGRASIETTSEGARRVVTGELKVRAPLVGGRVEQAIVEGLQEYLVAEAPAVDRYLGT